MTNQEHNCSWCNRSGVMGRKTHYRTEKNQENKTIKIPVRENVDGRKKEGYMCIFCQVDRGQIKKPDGTEFNFSKRRTPKSELNPLHPEVEPQVPEYY